MTAQVSRLFTYGTLMRDGPLHGYLGGCRFVEEASTEPKCTLRSLGMFPGLELSGSSAVPGEVFEIPIELFDLLDLVEGTANGLFERRTIVVSGLPTEAYVIGPRLQAESFNIIDRWSNVRS